MRSGPSPWYGRKGRQLLIDTLINRIDQRRRWLPKLKKKHTTALAHHSIIQKDSPGKAGEANWLQPQGRVYLVMRRVSGPKTRLNGILANRQPGSVE